MSDKIPEEITPARKKFNERGFRIIDGGHAKEPPTANLPILPSTPLIEQNIPVKDAINGYDKITDADGNTCFVPTGTHNVSDHPAAEPAHNQNVVSFKDKATIEYLKTLLFANDKVKWRHCQIDDVEFYQAKIPTKLTTRLNYDEEVIDITDYLQRCFSSDKQWSQERGDYTVAHKKGFDGFSFTNHWEINLYNQELINHVQGTIPPNRKK